MLFLAFTGNEEAQERWDRLDQSESRLKQECEGLSQSPSERRAMNQEMAQLDAFFAAAEEGERQRDLERKRLEAAAKAEEERRQREAFFEAVAEAKVQEEAEARRQGEALVSTMCRNRGGWYYYELDPVRVWLDHCNPAGGGGWDDNAGDLDCEDIGYEFEIDPWNDPDNLDGDGDGVACEGW